MTILNSRFTLFFGSFLFSTCVALLIQLVILPISGLGTEYGLLKGGDWLGFHVHAVELAAAIETEGLSSLPLRPHGQFPTFVLAFMYAFSGIHHPAVAVPVYSFFFSMSVLSFWMLLKECIPGNHRLFGIMPLFFFPSVILLYSQPHKDMFTVCGIMFLALTVARTIRRNSFGIVEFGLLLSALVLIVVCRSYLAVIILFALVIAFGLHIFRLIWFGLPGTFVCIQMLSIYIIIFFSLSLSGLGDGELGSKVVVSSDEFSRLDNQAAQNKDLRQSIITGSSISEEGTISNRIEEGTISSRIEEETISSRINVVMKINAIRVGFYTGHPHAGSAIDYGKMFTGYVDVLLYYPRAFAIGLFAPFPTKWFASSANPGGGVMRLVSAIEMFAFYAALFMVCVKARFRLSQQAQVVILFAVVGIIVYAYLVPIVGALYRMRIGFWQIIFGFLLALLSDDSTD